MSTEISWQDGCLLIRRAALSRVLEPPADYPVVAITGARRELGFCWVGRRKPPAALLRYADGRI